MNKNIMRMIVCTLVPFNLAMSMDAAEQGQGFRGERSGTIVDLPKKHESDNRTRSTTIVESHEPLLKFKGFYPAPNDSGDIFSRIPLSKFFMQFDPAKNEKEIKKTVRALMKRGIRSYSTPKKINAKYKRYLTRLIRREGEYPAHYVQEIATTCSHFNAIYAGIIKPYIRISEEDAARIR